MMDIFSLTRYETATENNEIDLEIRIYEGQQARVNKINVNGNTKTNDHVIMRELEQNLEICLKGLISLGHKEN